MMGIQKDTIKSLIRSSKQLGVLRKLADVVPVLSQTEQILVKYILHHPREVASMSAADLASAAGVSEATLFRLCRQLDVGGYALLRDQIREAIDGLDDDYVTPISARQTGDDEFPSLHQNVYDGIRTLLDMSTINEDDIQRSANAISQATRLSICGMGPITARLAEMAAFSFQRLGLTCMLWVDPQTIHGEFAHFDSKDVIIALSHSGENEAVANFLEMANRHSATTIALTNYSHSIVAKQAQIPLVTHMRESSVQNFDLLPRVSQMLVIQVLVNIVREKAESSGRDELTMGL